MKVKFPRIRLSQKDTSIRVSESFSSAGIKIGISSVKGMRQKQEDVFLVPSCLMQTNGDFNQSSATYIFGIFDGHGGNRCSKYLSENLINVLLEEEEFTSDLSAALKKTFITLNQNYFSSIKYYPTFEGSTAICVLLRENKLLVANVGDCRAILLSKGKCTQLSNDHKLHNLKEQNRIIALGGNITIRKGIARVNGILAVTRAFGDFDLKDIIKPDPELTNYDLNDSDDFIVIASDGLWDVLSNQDVCDIIYLQRHVHLNCQVLAEHLVNKALERHTQDNVSCMVLSIEQFLNNITIKQISVPSTTTTMMTKDSIADNTLNNYNFIKTLKSDTQLLLSENKQLKKNSKLKIKK